MRILESGMIDMQKMIDGELLNVPRHVAIIMDGNGRWAKRFHMPRTFGHKRGASVVEKTCENADEIGIKYLTLYAFSTENWKRPEEEVGTLMDLFYKYLVDFLDRVMKNNIRVRVIGERSRLSSKILQAVDNIEQRSKNNDGLQFTIAINYGSRDEMIRAMKKMAADGHTDPGEITEELFSSYLDTAEIPDPDLLIRTSGEQRISNYLLWQIAYAELYFTPVLWPEFDRNALIDAVRAYSRRDRRYGGVK